MADDKKGSIFAKALEFTDAFLEGQIAKARAMAQPKKEAYSEADFEWGKAVTKDRGTFVGVQGFHEKAGVLSFDYQKQIAIRSSIIAAILKLYSNKVASHSEYVPQGSKVGFKIALKHEQDKIDELMEEMFGEDSDDTAFAKAEAGKGGKPKAKPEKKGKPAPEGGADIPEEGEVLDPEALGGLADMSPEEVEDIPLTDEEKLRVVRKELDKRTRKKKREIAEFILNCGEKKDRPFETLKWNFNSFLKAFIWDSLVYDQAAIELVPKEAEVINGKLQIHHFQPVDGSTVRYASPELNRFRDGHMAVAQDILYPEEELKALEERDALELNPDRLAANEYKYVQVVRGRIERAFTADELKVGMRNPTTDIYANGYSTSELEILTTLITSHLHTENYNRQYFQNGFSAKGILHVKANLNRSKLEELRRNWSALVKGNRNSFQTPIMAGMDEVSWIPLTQSHSDMEFNSWLQYLIRLICAIYLTDPAEINCGLRDMGGGGGISGDNTKEKLSNSRDKGFIPLMSFLRSFINVNIVDSLDPDYQLEWVGLEDMSEAMAKVALDKELVQWKLTINEVRALDGLPPIKDADTLLNPVFFQWFSTMSPQGQHFVQKQAEQANVMAMAEGGMGEEVPVGGENLQGDSKKAENAAKAPKTSGNAEKASVKKSSSLIKSSPIQIEFYKLGGED